MGRNAFQKIWLIGIIALALAVAWYGSNAWKEVSSNGGIFSEIFGNKEERWQEVHLRSYPEVVVQIPSTWESGILSGDVESAGYIFREPGQDYTSPYEESNMRSILPDEEILEGTYAIALLVLRGGHIVDASLENAQREEISVSGLEATKMVSDGHAAVAVKGDSYSYYIETFDYNKPEIFNAFQHMIETIRIGEVDSPERVGVVSFGEKTRCPQSGQFYFNPLTTCVITEVGTIEVKYVEDGQQNKREVYWRPAEGNPTYLFGQAADFCAPGGDDAVYYLQARPEERVLKIFWSCGDAGAIWSETYFLDVQTHRIVASARVVPNAIDIRNEGATYEVEQIIDENKIAADSENPALKKGRLRVLDFALNGERQNILTRAWESDEIDEVPALGWPYLYTPRFGDPKIAKDFSYLAFDFGEEGMLYFDLATNRLSYTPIQ